MVPITLEDIAKKAKAKGIKVVPTNLVGGGKNSNSDKFEIDEKRHMVKNVLLIISLYTVPLRKDLTEHTLIRNTVIIAP